MRTQIGIIGGGPAGTLLSLLLDRAGIDSVVLELRDRETVETTVRAGVLEHDTAELLKELGVGERMVREGAVHTGVELRFDGTGRRIDLEDLTGKSITVYGQQEVVKDLYRALDEAGKTPIFSAAATAIEGIESESPKVRFRRGARLEGGDLSFEENSIEEELDCDFVVGADGYFGVSRKAVPESVRKEYTRVYPFGWFGVLVEGPPSTEELIYASSERGFALVSTRSPTVQRLYFQCDPDDSTDNWPDEKIWDELKARLEPPDGSWTLKEGRIFQKDIVRMRSFVTEPMRYGRLFLAGDAAHIVPPTGAKGMNLAVADVRFLAEGLVKHYGENGENSGDLLDRYSEACLKRVWKTSRFSWWMTSMLHEFPDSDELQHRLQVAELDYVTSSRAAATTLAENYVGLPHEDE